MASKLIGCFFHVHKLIHCGLTNGLLVPDVKYRTTLIHKLTIGKFPTRLTLSI